MNTKHTQGKWRFNENDGFIYTGTSTKIALVVGKDSEEEEDANAQLMVSAPELLEALIIAEQQVNYLVRQFDTGQSKSLFKIRKAIQKATS